MKLPNLTSRGLVAAAVLLATNIVTCLITTQVVRSRDFSLANMNCLLNWGSIIAEFEDARVRELPNVKPEDEAQIYRIHESNARFLVHYPQPDLRTGGGLNRPLTLFCWAVAADDYRSDDVDIPVDPLVWKAFLADGPRGLPLYWDPRESLTRAGAGRGLIRGDDSNRHFRTHKLPPYVMGPLFAPYHPINETPPAQP